MGHYTVEIATWAKNLGRRHTVAGVRRAAIASMVFGGLLLLLAIAALAAVVITWSKPELLFGVVLLGVAGGLMLWNAPGRLRSCRGRGADEEVSFVAPYAFQITDETLEFPAVVGRDAESWPLETITATIESRFGQPALKLKHPGRAPRRFFAKVLLETPEQVLETLHSRL